MLLIDNKLVSNDVIEQQFVCNLNACKGACCWEGDFGAPLEAEEKKILESIYDTIKPFLRPEGIQAIEEQGHYVFIEETEDWATTLVNNRECAYLTFQDNGMAFCGIEKAFLAGVIDFRKPISCHLFPIRTVDLGEYEGLNYEEWHICNDACKKGTEEKVPVYQFVKDALVRKYGADFYEELDAAAQHQQEQKKKHRKNK